MFELVIFDWDGTLADTLPAVVSVFQKVLRGIGCKVSDEFLVKRIGIGARNMFKDALRSNNILFNETTIDELMEKKAKIQLEILNQIQLFPGAVELLKSLRPKLKLALATMSNRYIIDRMLRIRGLEGYFDFVITADDVSKPKPDPEVFVACASKIGCPPEKCLVIEDSVFGVVAARMAKMRCIAIPSGAYSKVELEKENPDLIVDSLVDTERILDFIFSSSKS
ncbi:HAD family phosphatase [Candidatus Bathyarchaeota archaeon]|nr:HAD family phosphatase [Candidatus Bathyarchaeota archaeon]